VKRNPPLTADMKRLRLRQIDRQLHALVPIASTPRPRDGWAKAIREALGIQLTQQARTLRIAPSVLTNLEKSEARSSITLKSLDRLAASLNCRLVYAMVPATSLEELRRERAKRIATATISRVEHSMRLEDQAISEAATERQIEELTNTLLNEWRAELWDGE
jgi:predicted DNA-binding mobile mystery protein A